MPTATSNSSGRRPKAKGRAKAARRGAATSRTGSAGRARKATKTTVKSRSTRTTVKSRSTRARRAKAARTRAVNQTRTAVAQAEIASRDTGGVFGEYAERAVLIPVGVALTARDRVVSGVSDTLSNYSSGAKAQAQLRRFERRGATARNRLEREVRKTRVRVERQLRQRRRKIERSVGDLEQRRDAVAKNSSDLANELANRVQERILTLV
jgi:hypothetical protein